MSQSLIKFQLLSDLVKQIISLDANTIFRKFICQNAHLQTKSRDHILDFLQYNVDMEQTISCNIIEQLHLDTAPMTEFEFLDYFVNSENTTKNDLINALKTISFEFWQHLIIWYQFRNVNGLMLTYSSPFLKHIVPPTKPLEKNIDDLPIDANYYAYPQTKTMFFSYFKKQFSIFDLKQNEKTDVKLSSTIENYLKYYNIHTIICEFIQKKNIISIIDIFYLNDQSLIEMNLDARLVLLKNTFDNGMDTLKSCVDIYIPPKNVINLDQSGNYLIKFAHLTIDNRPNNDWVIKIEPQTFVLSLYGVANDYSIAYIGCEKFICGFVKLTGKKTESLLQLTKNLQYDNNLYTTEYSNWPYNNNQIINCVKVDGSIINIVCVIKNFNTKLQICEFTFNNLATTELISDKQLVLKHIELNSAQVIPTKMNIQKEKTVQKPTNIPQLIKLHLLACNLKKKILFFGLEDVVVAKQTLKGAWPTISQSSYKFQQSVLDTELVYKLHYTQQPIEFICKILKKYNNLLIVSETITPSNGDDENIINPISAEYLLEILPIPGKKLQSTHIPECFKHPQEKTNTPTKRKQSSPEIEDDVISKISKLLRLSTDEHKTKLNDFLVAIEFKKNM